MGQASQHHFGAHSVMTLSLFALDKGSCVSCGSSLELGGWAKGHQQVKKGPYVSDASLLLSELSVCVTAPVAVRQEQGGVGLNPR